MNVTELVDLLGVRADDPSLKRKWAQYGIDLGSSLVLAEGEFNAYVVHQSEGIELVFTDAAMFLGQMDVPVGEGPLYFTGIFVYRERRDGYERYEGPLPFGLNAAIDRGSLLLIFGTPSWHRSRADGRVAAERWDLNDSCRVQATYATEEQLSVLSLSKPDKRE